jgi:hypothetical protein
VLGLPPAVLRRSFLHFVGFVVVKRIRKGEGAESLFIRQDGAQMGRCRTAPFDNLRAAGRSRFAYWRQRC